MNPRDHNYLLLQFQNKIYSKNATEFQTFFEDIMDKVYPDFKRVPAGGGDGGNDGWIKSLGNYYQVYAPYTPVTKESEAAKKFRKDFQSVKDNWDHISEVKEYFLVFNDKYHGSKKTEETAAELKKENPKIKFEVFLAKNLEQKFFSLSETDVLAIGFDIDARRSIEIVRDHLQKAEEELDNENTRVAVKILETCKEVISDFDDTNLILDLKLLECRCLQKQEKITEAKEKYKNLSTRYPDDPRPVLCLAELYLSENRFNKNRALLNKARSVDSKHWLLKLQELARKINRRENIDVANINELKFPNNNPREKSNFYRLYAIFYEAAGDKIRADSFIEKGIHLYPEMLTNRITKLLLAENRLALENDPSKAFQKAEKLLRGVRRIEQEFDENRHLRPRVKAQLNIKKLLSYSKQENFRAFEKVSVETFYLIFKCYFDKHIEGLLINLQANISLSATVLNDLVKYLGNTKVKLSNDLLSALIVQFSIRDTLFSDGKDFFSKMGDKEYLQLIDDIKNESQDDILSFLGNDLGLATSLASTLKDFPRLREKVIESLSDNERVDTQKLLLALRFDEGKFDEAFDILKTINLERLNALECRHVLKIVREKSAWDTEIVVRETLLKKEKNEKDIFWNKLNLLTVYYNLDKHLDVIKLGEELLEVDKSKGLLTPKDKEMLLSFTLSSCVSRGKIDPNINKKLNKILESYILKAPSFNFKINVEARVHLVSEQPEKALFAIVEGVKIKKILSSEEYAKLYFLLAIRVANRIKLSLDSLGTVEEGLFVKATTIETDENGEFVRRTKSQWYYIGDENELDAIKIDQVNEKYKSYIGKKVGDKVVFENPYGPNQQKEIGTIYSIEQYILWQSLENFKALTESNDLEDVWMISMPHENDTVDLENLKNFFEDQRKTTEPLFKIYCKGNNVPLAMLAINEGGLPRAIGRIQTAQKGYVNFSNGTTEEFQSQKNIAQTVIEKEMSFYLDGTSAIILSETGLLKKIYTHLPSLKVPQSVINLLENVAEKFRHSAGQKGVLQYNEGDISFSTTTKEKNDLVRSNFVQSIQLLESKPENVSVISSANKQDCMSENGTPAELCDACILAQKEGLPVLTEDFIYTQMNELETKKNAPEYFSSLALLRVLYEKGKVSFNEYLYFFGYLSSYRFRFLSFNTEDLEKAVFGDGQISNVAPENIRNFNFNLTLSEEYGVDFRQSFNLVGGFLLKQLTDSTVTPDVVEKILIEITETFPTKVSKRQFAEMLLKACSKEIGKSKKGIVVFPENLMVDKKMKRLTKLAEVFDPGTSFSAP